MCVISELLKLVSSQSCSNWCHLRAVQTGVISELLKLVSSQSCSHWCFLIFSSSALFYTVTVRTSSGNVTSSPVTVIIPGACCLCTPGYNLYIRTYVPTYIHTCMHTYAYIRAYTHIHTYILYIRFVCSCIHLQFHPRIEPELHNTCCLEVCHPCFEFVGHLGHLYGFYYILLIFLLRLLHMA